MGGKNEPLKVTLAAAAPIVEIGDWSSYIVLPSTIRRHMSKQKTGLRRKPTLVTRDGFVTYVVHRQTLWTPWVNKMWHTTGHVAGSYTGCKIVKYRHYSKRKNRGIKKHYPPNNEQRRIRDRSDRAILTAFRELNLLPKEEQT
jgi:hypothetical protein